MAVLPLGNCAQAVVLTAGNGLLSQSGSSEEAGAQTGTGLPPGYDKTGSRMGMRLYAGFNFRTDTLDWNIAGNMNGTDPNILSELTWDNLGIYEVSLGFSSFVKQSVYFRGYLSYGRITSGDNQDSDFAADDRQDEFSRSNNSADDGSTIDISLGAGYMLPLIPDVLTIIPMAGLSYHRQNLTITDGYQTIPPLGAFPDLDSTYEAQWRGPWVGLEIQLDMETGQRIVPRIYYLAGLEYHWALFDAKADWNLRSGFEHPKSFEQEADGKGVTIKLGLGTSFNENWSLEIGYTQQQWSAEDGLDRVFFSDGTYGETRLNEVNWASRTMGLAVRYQF